VLAAAPDGSSIVYVGKSGENGRQLYLKRTDRLDVVPLPGTEDALNPFFSPDAKWVGFFAGGKLKKISIADGAIHTVCDCPIASGAAWGSDNVIVFAGGLFRPGTGAQPGGLLQVPASGGTPRTLTSPGPGEAQHRWPSLLPGGRVVVYTTTNSCSGLEEPRLVAVGPAANGPTRQATYVVRGRRPSAASRKKRCCSAVA
jgi:serine/threonine-protein kinase